MIDRLSMQSMCRLIVRALTYCWWATAWRWSCMGTTPLCRSPWTTCSCTARPSPEALEGRLGILHLADIHCLAAVSALDASEVLLTS